MIHLAHLSCPVDQPPPDDQRVILLSYDWRGQMQMHVAMRMNGIWWAVGPNDDIERMDSLPGQLIPAAWIEPPDQDDVVAFAQLMTTRRHLAAKGGRDAV